MNSANGTFVNNQKVKDVQLEAGDRINLGQTTLVFSLGRGEASSSGPSSS